MEEFKKNINSLDYKEEDEIDLRELFAIILKNKFKIIGFTFVVTFFAFLYVLSIPNSYKSYVILSPQGEQKSVGGGLSSLASLAGISVGSSSSKDPAVMMQKVLEDFAFHEYMIKKYNLEEKLNNQSNLVFAFGFSGIYSLTHSDNKNIEEDKRVNSPFGIINFLKNIISVDVDKKSSMITMSVELKDRFLAKEILDIYLKEVINRIKNQDMKEIDKQIEYYKKELSSTFDVSLKEELSKSLSSLMQKKVFSHANDYYFVSKVVDSRVPFVEEKSKPKRGLILVVSFVTSFILAIFLVFFLEFIKKEKDEA